MTQHISPADLKLIDTQPRVMDLRLADALGFDRDRKIRDLIKRSTGELQQHGEVCTTVGQTSQAGGRPSLEYWLNEPQSLLICMFARTENAAEVRKEIIRVFMDWRAAHAQPQKALPAPDLPSEIPGEDGPLNQYLAKLATLRECRLIHGPRAAARLWQRLGMPAVKDSVIEELDDGRRCLAHLLNRRSNTKFDDRGDVDFEHEVLIRDDIELAWEGDSHAMEFLAQNWLLRPIREGNDGLFVPNQAVKVFLNTEWSAGRHMQALRRLPGASPMRHSMLGSQCRGTFIPAGVIEAIPVPRTD